jgi:glutamine amidotransferase
VTRAEVDLVDVGGGNTGSVRRCLNRLGVVYHDVDANKLPDGSRPLILPGVGAFGAVMESLRRSEIDRVVPKLVKRGTPYLGICVGMQVLFESSEESPGSAGLGLIPGKVVRFQAAKVPQIGWNRIQPEQDGGWPEGFVYFVNSYYPEPTDENAVLYRADYGVPFCAAVHKDNITAFQFHPEKSGQFGGQLLERWIDSVSSN